MIAKPLLNSSMLPAPQRRVLPERVLQFGEGAFLRGYFDWMLETMNRQGLFNGKALVIKPRAEGKSIDELNAQDGLFTLWIRGGTPEWPVDSKELISAISRGLNPATSWAGFLDASSNADLRFVVSNTTEAGLAYAPEGRPEVHCPAGYPAKLAAFLYRRFQHFEGSAQSGMILIPLELLENNGGRLKAAVLRHASDWNLELGFSAWIEKHCRFINSLVDRIVPGKPAEPPELPYRDELLLACEPFHLLVLEAEEDLGGELPLRQAGLNVRFVKDLAPYRELKLRILNGAHSFMASYGLLKGFQFVDECVADADLRAKLDHLMLVEAAAVLELPKIEVELYAGQVMERFKNPYLRHPLANIALNATSKFKSRLLPTLLDSKGSLPETATAALGALFAFHRVKRNDEATAIDYFSRFWAAFERGAALEPLCSKFLSDSAFWGTDLSLIAGLDQAVANTITDFCTTEELCGPPNQK